MIQPSNSPTGLPTNLPTSPIHPVLLRDRDDHGVWRACDATVRDIRERTTVAARRAITQAAARGLKIEIFATTRTEIIGGFGHKMVISHGQQEGQPRVTRFRLARLDGTILDTINAARAAAWIAAQPRADRCRTVTPCAVASASAGPGATATPPRRARRARTSNPTHLSIVR